MDPQTPPTSAATYAHHQPYPDYAYSEKDAYAPQPYLPSQRYSRGSNGRSHDSVISHPFSPKPSSAPSPTSSVSSAGRKHRSMQEIQQSPNVNLSYPAQAHIDPEKAAARSQRQHADVTTVLYDSSEYHEKGPEEKSAQLLLFLSGPCALLSLVITIWTLLSLFIALILQPFRLCSKAPPSLGAQLTTFLAPPLNLQLRLIYSHSPGTEYKVPMLIVIHLFSPIVAIGVAIAAWTAAFFWFFSAILGDPAGQDEGHNDGKDSLLGVRRWWDKWLSRGLKSE